MQRVVSKASGIAVLWPKRSLSKPNRSAFVSLEWSQGWRLTAHLGLYSCVIVLLFNIALLIWSLAFSEEADGVQVLFSGKCSKAAKINSVGHLFINGFSTILLASSNFCMQKLCAPTRKDIDEAHQRKDHLDIGTQSPRNLMRFGPKRHTIWLLLAISSLPLHLLYNSAVYSQRVVYDYQGFSFTSDEFLNSSFTHFEQAASSAKWPHFDYGKSPGSMTTFTQRLISLKQHQSDLVRLSCKQCVEAHVVNSFWGKSSNKGDFVAIHSTQTLTNTSSSMFFGKYSNYEPLRLSSGLKSDLCETGDAWNDFGHQQAPINGPPMQYCLSRTLPERCRVRTSTTILSMVIAANLLKIIGIAFTLMDKTPGLLTLGDAVQSLLLSADPETSKLGVLTQAQVEATGPKRRRTYDRLWQVVKFRRWHAVPRTQWYTCNILCCGALVTFAIFTPLYIGYQPSVLKTDGLGGDGTTFSLIGVDWHGIERAAMMANVPQFFITLVYLFYNNLWTRKCIAAEWGSFGRRPRSLRTTEARGEQTSSHFLGLPYRYSLPLGIASALLHWLASQALFVISVAVFDSNGKQRKEMPGTADVLFFNDKDAGLGFSSLGVLLCIIVGAVIVIAGWIDDLRRLPSDMPLVRTNSAAISAACHSLSNNTKDVVLKPLKWGIIAAKDGVSYCAFTDEIEKVRPLKDGDVIARPGIGFSSTDWKTDMKQEMLESMHQASRLSNAQLQDKIS